MKIAIVFNRDSRKVINLFGLPNREKIGLRLIEDIREALRRAGHTTIALEGDRDLIDRLEEFMPRVVKGERPGMVLNLSYGIQGQARYTHVPSILEMVGIPYVGSGPLAHSIALDKVVTKMILVQHGLPTPEFAVLEDTEFEAPDLAYPIIVKPKHEAVSFGLNVVHDGAQLREAAGVIFERFGQAVLAERYVEGREVNVGLLGNAPPVALPPVELSFDEGGPRIYSYEDKTGKSERTIELVCPAPIAEDLTARAQDLARRAFSAIGCFDCARVDMRLDDEGRLYILEINSLPSLGERGSYVRAAAQSGLDFSALVKRLVEVASARYFGTPRPPELANGARDPKTSAFHFLTERRDHMEAKLRSWTNRSSRTSDPIGLEGARRALDRTFRNLSLAEVPDLSDAASVSTWETDAGFEDGTLLVGHLDVPVETGLPEHGFRREPEWLYGEGIGTTRAPLVMAEFALRALRSLRQLRSRRIGVLYYRDEGLDGRRSAPLIREAMGRARNVLVLRPGSPTGNLYVRRRGERRYRLLLEGAPRRPGTRSKRPEVLGWFARKIEELTAASSRRERASVSVAELRTERYRMLLPHRVHATILVTTADAEAADRLDGTIREILGNGGPSWDLQLLSDRPPLVPGAGGRDLAGRLAEIGHEWDVPLGTESSLWPSVAGLAPGATSVVCGVGPAARDLYTPQEAVLRISLVQRTIVLAQFLLRQPEEE